MKLAPVPVGARMVDSLPFSRGGTPLTAKGMAAEGVQGVALYLGAAGPLQVSAAHAAGLGVVGVTFGGQYNGAAAVAQAKALGMPAGWPIFLDLEAEVVGPQHAAMAMGRPTHTTMRSMHRSMIMRALHVNASIDDLKKKVIDWVSPVRGAGFLPCLYVGVPQPFTSAELWSLPVVRYWKGQGLARDRFGNTVEPDHCGWSLTQMWPSQMCGGVLVDHNMAGHDYANGGRGLSWAVSD